jgi:hypothetical protein
MKNYIYTFSDIVKALINYKFMVVAKSKNVNPNLISNSLNVADFEETIIKYVDSKKLLKLIGFVNQGFEYIIYAFANGSIGDEIAKVLNQPQIYISRCKNKYINQLLRELQR